jgi:hypothetical protein
MYGIAQQADYLKCEIEMQELESLITVTLQLKPFAEVLFALLSAEMLLDKPKTLILYKVIFSVLESSEFY